MPCSILYADGELSIEPGKYKITKTTKTSFDTTAATRTSEECITNPDLDPESILPNKKNCTISNLKSENHKTTFEFICKESGKTSELKGYAEYSAKSGSISSQIKLEGSHQGEKLIVESTALGERVGGCDPPTHFNDQPE